MQFKIPQNVQLEDKIVGPLTLRQLIILAIGGGIAYAIYVALARDFYWEIWSIPVFIVTAITLAIAFLRPKSLSFIKFILVLIESTFNAPNRHWVQGSGDTYRSVTHPKPERKISKKEENKHKADEETLAKLDRLTKILDAGGQTPNNQ